MGKIKVRKFMKDSLREKYEKGHGKLKDKDVHNSTAYIHSHDTYKTYVSQCNHFADWLLTKGITEKEEAFKMIPEYGKKLEMDGKSAWTIYTAMSAIAKAYSVSTLDLGYKPPKRERASIKRSRYSAERDKRFSVKNNQELIIFCSCTGLRRRELEALHGNQIGIKMDGTFYIKNVKGKGGKIRDIDIIGTPTEVKKVKEIMMKAKDGKVFHHVHSAFDEHYYRSIYACRAYNSKARSIEELTDKEKYICRKDKAGIVYDRTAMKYASVQLGHERVEVISNNYLHNL